MTPDTRPAQIGSEKGNRTQVKIRFKILEGNIRRKNANADVLFALDKLKEAVDAL